MTKPVTAELILNEIKERIEQKLPIPESWWLNASAKLNIFFGVIADELADLSVLIAKDKVEYLDDGKTASEAIIRCQATTQYADMEKKKAKLTQIVEFIRIAKKRADLVKQEKDLNYNI